MVQKRGTRRRGRTGIKKLLDQTFRSEFPTDTVDVSDGYMQNIHIMVVSRRFDGMTEADKSDLMWNIIDRAGLSDAERLMISLILPLSPGDIK